jgi:hypothetical protein
MYVIKFEVELFIKYKNIGYNGGIKIVGITSSSIILNPSILYFSRIETITPHSLLDFT